MNNNRSPASEPPSSTRRSSSFLAAIIASVAAFCPAVLFAGTFSSAVETIQFKELQNHCAVLASDTLEGRETGTRGGQAAGAYIVNALRKQKKIQPAGADGDFFQPFPANSRNILATLPGGDPKLKREFVLIGAHYDHVGYGTARNSRGPIGYIHNGADDNASGTAALLEIIDAFSSLDARPARSLLFAFWDGEEKGMLGSEYWAKSPTVPLDQVRLVFNIDMIGRLAQNRADVYGSRTGPGLRQFLASQNSDEPLSLAFSWEVKHDSDHYSFYSRRIPFLMVFTGKHPEYHTPYDDVDKLNVNGMQRVTRLLFRAAHAATEQPTLPAFRPAAFQEGVETQRIAEAPWAQPTSRLGVTWNAALAKRNEVVLTEVEAGSPADAAGLRPGDRIVEFDGWRAKTANDFRDAVLASPTRTTVAFDREGEKERQLRQLTLNGLPEQIGIAWRIDDAEPGCLIISRVVSGSPAYRAGLRPNDRIEGLLRQKAVSSDDLAAQLQRTDGPLDLQTERDGRRGIVHIDVHPRRRSARTELLK